MYKRQLTLKNISKHLQSSAAYKIRMVLTLSNIKVSHINSTFMAIFEQVVTLNDHAGYSVKGQH